MSAARTLYTLAAHALRAVAPLYLRWRGRRQPEYLAHWDERFARYAAARATAEPTLWIHAVSVGETRAAQPLIAALRSHRPECRLLLTHMTPTGRETGRQLFGDDIEQLYLPYDTPAAVARFVEHVRPVAGIVMETELWPNLIAACVARRVPVALVNARLSARSTRGYAHFGSLTREMLGQLALIAAQSEPDAENFRALGAPRIEVMGNLKFDNAPPESLLRLGAQMRAGYAGRPAWLAASTREGEETLILAAWREARKVGAGETASGPANPLLVLVPRHPQRFDEVAALLDQGGWRWQRRSAGLGIAPQAEIVLGDSMGELFAYYAAADLAFIGGSLLDYGCQNLIEACAVGTPVLIGPSTYNFAEAAHAALAAGAARQATSAESLVTEALGLLAAESARAAMAVAGREFAAAHRGATDRCVALLAPLIRAGR